MIQVFTNIKSLVQVEENPVERVCGSDMAKIQTIENAFLIVRDDKIENFGKMADYDTVIQLYDNEPEIREYDITGRMIFPTFCDSHTHIVYAGSREIEYIDKIRGLSYEEIAQRGGGILNSAKRLAESSVEELVETAWNRLEEMKWMGTGAIEIKSGYGLYPEEELKMLRAIKKLRQMSPLTIRATFLAAHAIPMEYRGRQSEYVDMVINETLPMVAAEELADYIDVFCDKGFFTVEDADRILMAGMKYGLRPKIHANELDFSGGVQVGVKYNALSVDHLEYIGDAEITSLLDSETMPTVLPGAAFFLDLPLSPVRKMIDAGLPVALASDYNPGSSPSGNMQFIASLGCIRYKMLPEEVVNATTINTAYALGVQDELGSIARGKRANFFITEPVPTYQFIPYAYGHNKVAAVMLNGEMQ
ncbi:MAG: imidazolonepropionase [Bacteroidales bacterium]|jgi:imidazolonepropionase|nr:imidazolonepropionase [Bacteroidales bacterium]